MEKRTAIINTIYTTSITIARFSALVILVQSIRGRKQLHYKKKAHLLKKVILFTSKIIDIFKQKTVWPNHPSSVNHYKVHQCTNTIHVHQVNVTAVSLSSVFQVGSAHGISADSRVKHFRILRGD